MNSDVFAFSIPNDTTRNAVDFFRIFQEGPVMPEQSFMQVPSEGFGLGNSTQPFLRRAGVTKNFGSGGDMAELGDGWAWPEDNQNWNDGYEASLKIALPSAPENPCTLLLEALPHLASGVAYQDVTFYFNGFRLGFWRLDTANSQVLEVIIEPELWFKRYGGGLGICTWHLPNSTKPSDISNSQDQRRLGLCFQSLTIHHNLSRPSA
ncbi:MAG TPA: hypothetical protein PLY97_02165 [Acidocella sp.]|nr:MAG: hypothetical protein B7Z80_00610 [Rhodospirillales bacterium 20-64-7]HQT46001.1 hypothetical protein [Acidocella sp.]